MLDVFTGLILLALIGGGFLVLRRLFDRRNTITPPMGMPWQQEYEDRPRDDYGRSFNPNPGYEGPGYGRPMYGPRYGNPGYRRPGYDPGYDPAGPGYGRPMYGPGYPPPQAGMSPWAAGGLGALGGGFLGYELGRMAGEHEQQAQEGYDPAMADSIGTFDAGGFSDGGGDFAGGDFGGGSEW